MRSNSLYDYPELYDRLRTPDQEAFEIVFDAIASHLGHLPASVMDPACGPGTWLLPFARRGIPVAGNDICPAMIAASRERCGQSALEFLVGDMCDLRFTASPFEVTIELSGTCGMLSDVGAFRRFLASGTRHTATGGLLLLTVFFTDPESTGRYPYVAGEWGPVVIPPAGRAWIKYEVVAAEPVRNIERVRRTVLTHGVAACPEPLVDCYDMFSWEKSRFFDVLGDFPGLRFSGAYKLFDDAVARGATEDLRGETTVVLQRLS